MTRLINCQRLIEVIRVSPEEGFCWFLRFAMQMRCFVIYQARVMKILALMGRVIWLLLKKKQETKKRTSENGREEIMMGDG